MRRLLAASLLCSLLCSLICVADDAGDGYLLIRVYEVDNEAIARIDLTHLDTGDIVRIRSNTCHEGSLSSRVCLVPAPAGRYFWSRFELAYKIRGTQSYLDGPGLRRTAPGSSGDSIEIVAGAINYIGDWELNHVPKQGARFRRKNISVDIQQNHKTLQLFYESFPDEAAQYEIYLSMLGKEAISLRDFLKLLEQQDK